MTPPLIFDLLFAGDTRPVLQLVCSVNGAARNFALPGLTLMFEMVDANGSQVIANRALGDEVDSGERMAGVLSEAWQSGDTSTAGDYKGRFKVVDSGGGVEHWPVGRWISIPIQG